MVAIPHEFIAAAESAGCKASTVSKKKPLYVHGIGAGSATCSETLQSQIAVQYAGDKPQVAHYDANIADGCGADLPAIFGLDSMTKGDAVILLREGKRCIAFPGKGGYRIEWSEGLRDEDFADHRKPFWPISYSLRFVH